MYFCGFSRALKKIYYFTTDHIVKLSVLEETTWSNWVDCFEYFRLRPKGNLLQFWSLQYS